MGIKSLSHWVILSFCLITLVTGCKPKEQQQEQPQQEQKDEQQKQTIKRPPNVNLSLHYISGAPNERAAIRLTLLNKIAISASRKKEDKKSHSTLTYKERLVPVELTMNQNDWLDQISFYTTVEGQGPTSINQGLKLVEAPKDNKLTFGTKEVYVLILGVDSTVALKPEQELFAEWKIKEDKILSNKTSAPNLAKDQFEELKRKAHVDYALGDTQSLLETGKQLDKLKPTSTTGPWYMGLALELKKDYKGALAAFKIALSRVPRPTPGEHFEPPMAITQRIQALQEKIK